MKCRIGCLEPGCHNQIEYDADEIEVPLYCRVHRTCDGRHSEVRVLKKPKSPEPEPETVIYKCLLRSCRTRRVVTKSDWIYGIPQVCDKCGNKMIYHKDTTKP